MDGGEHHSARTNAVMPGMLKVETFKAALFMVMLQQDLREDFPKTRESLVADILFLGDETVDFRSEPTKKF